MDQLSWHVYYFLIVYGYILNEKRVLSRCTYEKNKRTTSHDIFKFWHVQNIISFHLLHWNIEELVWNTLKNKHVNCFRLNKHICVCLNFGQPSILIRCNDSTFVYNILRVSSYKSAQNYLNKMFSIHVWCQYSTTISFLEWLSMPCFKKCVCEFGLIII